MKFIIMKSNWTKPCVGENTVKSTYSLMSPPDFVVLSFA